MHRSKPAPLTGTNLIPLGPFRLNGAAEVAAAVPAAEEKEAATPPPSGQHPDRVTRTTLPTAPPPPTAPAAHRTVKKARHAIVSDTNLTPLGPRRTPAGDATRTTHPRESSPPKNPPTDRHSRFDSLAADKKTADRNTTAAVPRENDAFRGRYAGYTTHRGIESGGGGGQERTRADTYRPRYKRSMSPEPEEYRQRYEYEYRDRGRSSRKWRERSPRNRYAY
ncbi:hypothetical protein BDV95DRAFT_570991 [Massariosphaeria phaeospora]|uniref:Uncharacterized protein n=1 Tax=Massariosphaeria phaeospora TaxID=100035 RepID=A0A7C8I6G6_9PLEO|nr:hypothetical protein BDV95DRAFT_570991 [Massariosphaeria phaeospora]